MFLNTFSRVFLVLFSISSFKFIYQFKNMCWKAVANNIQKEYVWLILVFIIFLNKPMFSDNHLLQANTKVKCTCF